ncbi:MAG: sulfite exporter TauE/SafE family protein [Candidatus Cloacimonetes bacterium]|nr:sulfite exporter TauE/SafE family protein [Candidatus Cloacimonadota bacterium]
MIKTLVEGVILGLTTGTACLVTCSPIYLPYLISEDRKLSKSIYAVLEISAGRFVSYLAFGAIAGYTGAQIASVNRELFTSIAYILLSAYLVLSAVRTNKKAKSCHVPKMARFTQSGIILGILTGINFCPSFLIALSKAVDLGGAFSGMMLFLGFFFGTSIFLLPLAFIGQISKVSKMKMVAQYASILVAIWFTFSGVKGLVHYYEHKKLDAQPSRLVEAFNPNIPLAVIASEENSTYFKTLQDSLINYTPSSVHYFQYNKTILDSINKLSETVLVIDSSILNESFDNYDYFQVEPDYDLSRMLKFMKFYTFKTRTHLHWEFIEKEEGSHKH